MRNFFRFVAIAGFLFFFLGFGSCVLNTALVVAPGSAEELGGLMGFLALFGTLSMVTGPLAGLVGLVGFFLSAKD